MNPAQAGFFDGREVKHMNITIESMVNQYRNIEKVNTRPEVEEILNPVLANMKVEERRAFMEQMGLMGAWGNAHPEDGTHNLDANR
jgi:hypothetical protein